MADKRRPDPKAPPRGPRGAPKPAVIKPSPRKDMPPAPGSIDTLKPREGAAPGDDSTPTVIDTPLERKTGTANPTRVPGRGTMGG